jgi:hypothetical protein
MLITQKYDFSFTGASVRLNEMLLVLRAWEIEKREVDFTNELGNGKRTTGRTIYTELSKRIKNLTFEQKLILLNADSATQKQIAFVAICKTYKFILDFTIEVIREKYLVFDYQISDGDYNAFVRQKTDLHPEIEKLTEITLSKIRQVTFKILEQVGMIDNIKEKNIQAQILNQQLVNAIFVDNPLLLKVLLVSDHDIQTHAGMESK